MSSIDLKLKVTPEIDIAKINVLLNSLKTSMGEFGKSITLMDPAKIQAEYDKIDAAIKTKKPISIPAPVVSPIKAPEVPEPKIPAGWGMVVANQALELTQKLAGAFGNIMDVGESYQKNLKAVGAFTGTTGSALDDLGNKARQLGIEFASVGNTSQQFEVFSSVLSKMGPVYGQNAEAMGIFAKNANILAKAGGIDVKQSVDVMTNAMLQFGLRTGDANKDAETSTRIINGLAASARAGAAQIPQVGEAILQVGVMAKTSKMSFEETAAAIQVMSVGGKTGAEAGVALRNVLGLLQRPSAEAEVAFRKMGLTSQDVARTMTKDGFGAAIEKLKIGMGNLSSDQEKTNALMKIFGMENASAAGIFMDNIGRYKEFLGSIKEGQEGVGTAFEMYAQKSGSASSMVAKWKAQIEDVFISISNTTGSSFNAVLMASTKLAPMIMSFGTLSPVLAKLGSGVADIGLNIIKQIPGFVSYQVAGVGSFTSVAAAEEAAGAAGVQAGVATKIAWGEVFLILAAATAIGVGLYALAGGFNATTESKLKDTEATIKNIESQKQLTLKQKETEIQHNSLIAKYEELIEQKKAGKDVDAELEKTMQKLNDVYPESIKLTGDHAENLKAVKEHTGLAGIETSKFTKENQSLVLEYEQLGKKENKSNEEKARMKVLTDQLNEVFPGVIGNSKDFASGLSNLQLQAGLSNTQIKGLNKELSDLGEQMRIQIQTQAVQQRDLIKDETIKKVFTWTFVTPSIANAQRVFDEFYSKLVTTKTAAEAGAVAKTYQEMLKTTGLDLYGKDYTNLRLSMSQQATAQAKYIETLTQKTVEETNNATKSVIGNTTDAFTAVKGEIAAYQAETDDWFASKKNMKLVKDLTNQISTAKKEAIASGMSQEAADAEAKALVADAQALQRRLKVEKEKKETSIKFNDETNSYIQNANKAALSAQDKIDKQESESKVKHLENLKKNILSSDEGIEVERLARALAIDKQINAIKTQSAIDSAENEKDRLAREDNAKYQAELKKYMDANQSTDELTSAHDTYQLGLERDFQDKKRNLATQGYNQDVDLQVKHNQEIEKLQDKALSKYGNKQQEAYQLMLLANAAFMSGDIQAWQKYMDQLQHIQDQKAETLTSTQQIIMDAARNLGDAMGEGLGKGKLALKTLAETVFSSVEAMARAYETTILAGSLSTPASILTFGTSGFAAAAIQIAEIELALAVGRGLISRLAGGGRADSPSNVIIGDNPYSPEWVMRDFDILAIIEKALQRYTDKLELSDLSVNMDGQLEQTKLIDESIVNISSKLQTLSNAIDGLRNWFDPIGGFTAETFIKVVDNMDQQQKLVTELQNNTITQTEYLQGLNRQNQALTDYIKISNINATVQGFGNSLPFTSMNNTINNTSIDSIERSDTSRLEKQNDIIIQQNEKILAAINSQILKGVFIDKSEMTDEVNRENNRRLFG